MANFEKIVTLYGSAGHAVGDSLTWVDLIIYDISIMILDKMPDFNKNWPRVAAIIANVAANERIKEYVAKRPVTAF